MFQPNKSSSDEKHKTYKRKVCGNLFWRTRSLPYEHVPPLQLVMLYKILTTEDFCKAELSYKKTNIHVHFFVRGHAAAQLVGALRYKPEGRGFDS